MGNNEAQGTIFMSVPIGNIEPIGRLFRMSRTAVLLIWDGPKAPEVRRIRVIANKTRVKPPVSLVTVPLADGQSRNLVAFRIPPLAHPGPVWIENDDRRVLVRVEDHAPLDRPTLADLVTDDVFAGVSGSDRVRIVRFLLNVCPGVLQIGHDPIFVGGLRRFLTNAFGRPRPVFARCTLPGDFAVCAAAVDTSLGPDLRAVVITGNAVSATSFAPIVVPQRSRSGGKGHRLLTVMSPAIRNDQACTVVVSGRRTVRTFSLRPDESELPDAIQLLQGLSSSESAIAIRRYLLDALAKIASDREDAAALLREIQIVVPRKEHRVSAPESAVAASADLMVGAGSTLFVTGRLDDPHRLVAAIGAQRNGVTEEIPETSLLRFRNKEGGSGSPRKSGSSGDTTERFAFSWMCERPAVDAAPVRLFLSLRSGRQVEFAEGPNILRAGDARDAVLAAVPSSEVGVSAAADCLEASVRALHAASLTRRGNAKVIDVGRLGAPIRTSVIMPVGRDPAIARCRAGMFAVDPAMVGVELVHVLADPSRRGEVQSFLQGIKATYGLPGRLVVVPDGSHSGAALNAGIAAARGEDLVILHEGAIPSSRGWLPPLLKFRANAWRGGIVGVRLMREDLAVCDEGLIPGIDDDGRWDVVPRRAGFPCNFGTSWHARRVSVLSPGCTLISRRLFERLGGFDEHYLVDDRCLADLCLNAHTHGLGVWLLSEPDMFRLEQRNEPCLSPEVLAVARELDRRRLEKQWRHHRQHPEATVTTSTSLATGAAMPERATTHDGIGAGVEDMDKDDKDVAVARRAA